MNKNPALNHRIVLGVMVIFVFSSCKTVKIEKPAEAYQPSVIKPQPSVIGFTTEAKLTDIQKELNRTFTGLIYEDNSLDDNGGDNLMVKAWKQGDITLSMKDNIMSYRVPLKLWIKAGFKVQKLGVTLSDYREVNGALALRFKTSVTVNPDWTLVTKTEPDGYEWLTDPVVKVAGMNIPVKFVADLILQGNLKTIGTSIDESIKDNFNLKSYADEAWKSLNRPVLLNEEYKLWLSFRPMGFFSSPIKAENGVIRHKSGVSSIIETTMGTQPVIPPQGQLPKLQIDNNFQDQIVINASVNLPFNEISSQAMKYLAGKTFTEGKRSVKIENVSVYGSNGRIITEALLSGSFKGTIYFSGIPSFQPLDSTLTVRDFDFDISTKNVLLKSAAWIYQGGLRNMISKHMVWSLAPEIKMLTTEINKNLKDYHLSDGIILNGKVSRITVGEILITPEGVKPFISAEGKLKVVINSFGARN